MTLSFAQAMKTLAAAGTEQNRAVYRRHGAKGDVFGVGFATLDGLARELGRDAKLAAALWKSKNADARLLATRVADPNVMTPSLLDAWAKEVDWYVGADALAKLATASPHAKTIAQKWLASTGEWTLRAGWHALALLTRDPSLTDAFFEPFIARIEREIGSAPNRAKDAMNAALIAIGNRNAAFAKLATRAAARIGKVDVDHGATACKTPNAALYIKRARAWLEAQAKKRQAKAKRAAKKTKVAAPSPRKAGSAAKRVKKKTAKKASPTKTRARRSAR